MKLSYLAGFAVAGFEDEAVEYTEQVQVTCKQCGEASDPFTRRDDGGADRTAGLDDLVLWAVGHECKTAGGAA